jgi:NADPH:quinone reductase-like Zn-dependent oxidoreductase
MKPMRARYHQRGPVPQDVIAAEPFEPGPLAAGHARVAVLAAPINPSDVLTLTGEYGLLPPLPAVGGNEGVGRVVALAPDAAGPPEGTLVLLPVGIGTWTTHVDVPAHALMPLPADADPRQLAMMTVNPPTALLLLEQFVELQPGDWVIQNAANSAVGGYLVQLAKQRGIHTINVVRRESAIAAVRAAGGEHVVVEADDLPRRVRALVGDVPVKLGIDCVGGLSTENLARCLAEGATLVNYGAMSGERCMISPRWFVFRDIVLRGFWLSQWFKTATPEQRRRVFGEVAALIAAGDLHARIQATYGLEHVREAVEAAAGGARDGKILLEPNGPSRAPI